MQRDHTREREIGSEQGRVLECSPEVKFCLKILHLIKILKSRKKLEREEYFRKE